MPEFLSTVVITGPGVLHKDRALVEKTIKARADGIEFIKQDPDAVAKAWAKEAEIKPESARRRCKVVDPDKHWVVGLASPKALETVAEEMRLIDLLPGGQRIDWNALIVQDFIPPDQRIELPGGANSAAQRRERRARPTAKVEAMRDVSLAVDEGEFVSIVGPVAGAARAR